MATADQVKSLVKAYIDRDDDRFKTIVLQIAAHEAKLGHDGVARDLKSHIEKLGKRVASVVQLTPQNPMLLLSLPKHDISELIVSDEITEKVPQPLQTSLLRINKPTQNSNRRTAWYRQDLYSSSHRLGAVPPALYRANGQACHKIYGGNQCKTAPDLRQYQFAHRRIFF